MAIMVSNKLTNRRRTARKPPVCHSGPAVGSILLPPEALQRTPLDKKLPGVTSPIVPRTGRCPPPPPPPPPCDVSIEPETASEEVWVSTAFETLACKDSLEHGSAISVAYQMTGGFVDHYLDPTNCSDPGLFEWTGTETGVFTVTATFTFSDSSTCDATATITVTN
jgi:hypothetical protein